MKLVDLWNSINSGDSPPPPKKTLSFKDLLYSSFKVDDETLRKLSDEERKRNEEYYKQKAIEEKFTEMYNKYMSDIAVKQDTTAPIVPTRSVFPNEETRNKYYRMAMQEKKQPIVDKDFTKKINTSTYILPVDRNRINTTAATIEDLNRKKEEIVVPYETKTFVYDKDSDVGRIEAREEKYDELKYIERQKALKEAEREPSILEVALSNISELDNELSDNALYNIATGSLSRLLFPKSFLNTESGKKVSFLTDIILNTAIAAGLLNIKNAGSILGKSIQKNIKNYSYENLLNNVSVPQPVSYVSNPGKIQLKQIEQLNEGIKFLQKYYNKPDVLNRVEISRQLEKANSYSKIKNIIENSKKIKNYTDKPYIKMKRNYYNNAYYYSPDKKTHTVLLDTEDFLSKIEGEELAKSVSGLAEHFVGSKNSKIFIKGTRGNEFVDPKDVGETMVHEGAHAAQTQFNSYIRNELVRDYLKKNIYSDYLSIRPYDKSIAELGADIIKSKYKIYKDLIERGFNEKEAMKIVARNDFDDLIVKHIAKKRFSEVIMDEGIERRFEDFKKILNILPSTFLTPLIINDNK